MSINRAGILAMHPHAAAVMHPHAAAVMHPHAAGSSGQGSEVEEKAG